MKNLYFLFVLFLIAGHTSIAQKLSIEGHVSDTTGAALTGATVMLLNIADSSLVNFGVTDKKGTFELKNVQPASYWLKVTFVGYKTYTQRVDPPSTGTAVHAGQIKMKESRSKLDEVVVEEKIPVVMKKDTIEYNAAAFKTIKNATVEDLLKKLPGVEVDNDGNITAQGETVKRVTVDGKEFFGGSDPKIATKNLPADAIKKVQVHDRKSDQAIFSGIDDGQREKSINLELKPEKRNGLFGNVAAGYGTDDRYQAKTNINKFRKGSQFSLLGMANNTNEQGFSMEEYMNFTGGSQQMMSGGPVRVQIGGDNSSSVPLNFGNRANGIMRNYAGGINFNNELSKKTEINGSYFFNRLNHDKIQSVYRENFLDTGKYIYTEEAIQNNTNSNHRLNFVVDHKIDSMNSLKLTTSMTYNATTAESNTLSRNSTVEGALINENESKSISEGSTASLNSSLLYRHRFAKKGRTFSSNLQLSLSESDRTGYLDALYRYSNESENRNVLQRNEQNTDTRTYAATFSYTEPLGNRKYLEANYSVRQNTNDVDRPVYDINSGEEVFNDSLSNQYTSDYIYHRGALNFKLNRKKYSVTVGAGFQNTQLKGDLRIQDVQIDRSYNNFIPAVHFNYDFSNTKHLRFDYETTVQEPTIQQLQPVVDNRDQLNPYVGNPNLRPAYQQSWRAQFTTFDPGTFISFFLFADVDYTTNAIVDAISNENFVRTTKPVNVPSNTNINTNATFSFPLNAIKSRFNLTATWREQRGVNLLDDMSYDIVQQTRGGNVRYNFHYKEIFNLDLAALFTEQNTEYSFDQPDQKFINTTYSAETNVTFLKNYQFTSAFEYLVYQNRSTDFDQAIPLLNFSISRFFLKNNAGELRLSANNVFDQAVGISQTSSINYVERTTTNSLGRYFMVTFVYALNKQLNPMGMRRPGPMMRIMR